MTPKSGWRAAFLKGARDQIWQMIGVVLALVIAVVTAVAAIGDDDIRPGTPAVTTPAGPVPGDVNAEVTGGCNAVGTGNSVNC